MSETIKLVPGIAWVDSCDYGGEPEDRRRSNMYDVDPTPLAAFVAAAIGLRDDLLDCMKSIAEDDQDGPIHLVHLVAACDLAARDVGGSLPTATSFPGLFGSGPGGMLTAQISPKVLPNIVQVLRREGLAAATVFARQCTRRERYRALDVLVHYVAGPITNLRIDIDNSTVIAQRDPQS
jgi:hypothetical protein